MKEETDKRYLDVINKIKGDVRKLYHLSHRTDLVMQYEMSERKIYSYLYNDYMGMLNERSQKMLLTQYREAQVTGGIVLFIRDAEMEKYKSFVI